MTILSVRERGGLLITGRWIVEPSAIRARFLHAAVMLAALVAIWSTLVAPSHAALGLTGSTVSKVSGDDTNVAQVYSNNPAGQANAPQQITMSATLIGTSLNNAGYNNANGWNFTYATQAQDNLVFPDLKVTTYAPWVVTQPTFTDPSGGKWGGQLTGEAGGGQLILSFNPGATDPLKGQAVQWIQEVNSTYYGGGPGTGSSIHLDGGPTPPSPFYNTYSAAGPTYFADVPGAPETNPATGTEYENNPVANVTFNVFLAVDNGPAAGGITDNVTIYAGLAWGYQYRAFDSPEPSSLLVWTGLGAAGLVVGRRYRRKPAA